MTIQAAPDGFCCNQPDAVFWNPYNRVVQCHACGQVWTPMPNGEEVRQYPQEQMTERTSKPPFSELREALVGQAEESASTT